MKHFQDETIAAIATPLGMGGVGIIRVSGEKAREILAQLFFSSNGVKVESHKMLHGWLLDPKTKERVDEVLACFMQAPRSYTGEDVVEFYCHGGIALLQKVLELTLAAGARLAGRGEFTKRAFLNGKIDLAQAEAVLDLVKAKTAVGAGLSVKQLEGKLSKIISEMRQELISLQAEVEARIDFPDDLPELDYNVFIHKLDKEIRKIQGLLATAETGKVYREGLATVIVGKPNVGKSSLLNALLGEDRAIVTDVPGTTRDTIEETVNINGLPLRIIDTAGIRHPGDKVEEFGIKRTEKELEASAFALLVIDGSKELDELDRMVLEKGKGKAGVVVLNKVDLGVKVDEKVINNLAKGFAVFKTSALFGTGIKELSEGIFKQVQASYMLPSEEVVIINARHKQCLCRAKEGLERALEGCQKELPVELIAIDLKDAILALGEITGEQVSEEVINAIFAQFCVGK